MVTIGLDHVAHLPARSGLASKRAHILIAVGKLRGGQRFTSPGLGGRRRRGAAARGSRRGTARRSRSSCFECRSAEAADRKHLVQFGEKADPRRRLRVAESSRRSRETKQDLRGDGKRWLRSIKVGVAGDAEPLRHLGLLDRPSCCRIHAGTAGRRKFCPKPLAF